MIHRKIHWRVFVSCSRAKGCNFSRLLTLCSKTFPVEHATQLWRSMRKTMLCKKTQESPGCFSLLIGPIRSRQFKRFWNWSSKSKCQGAHLDLTVNFHHKHSIVPTNCPWVSKDGSLSVPEAEESIPPPFPSTTIISCHVSTKQSLHSNAYYRHYRSS